MRISKTIYVLDYSSPRMKSCVIGFYRFILPWMKNYTKLIKKIIENLFVSKCSSFKLFSIVVSFWLICKRSPFKKTGFASCVLLLY